MAVGISWSWPYVVFGTILAATCLAPRAVHAEESTKSAAPAATPSSEPSFQASEHYVHHWLSLRPFTAVRISDDARRRETVAPQPGRVEVLVFLASWCQPCQRLMTDLLRLDRHYRPLNTDFIFVFSHDTPSDAANFVKDYGMSRAYLAGQDLLKSFGNPELPSIYVGDRHGWLANRYLKADTLAAAKLDRFLRYITAY